MDARVKLVHDVIILLLRLLHHRMLRPKRLAIHPTASSKCGLELIPVHPHFQYRP